MEKRVGYINRDEINFEEFQTELYFSGFTFKYIKIEDLDYNGEDSIIYINYDMNIQTHITDMMNIHSNIKNIYTNYHTLIKIANYIPETIENVYTGDITINNYYMNKKKYFIFLSNNEEDIIDKLRRLETEEMTEILEIKNRFNEDVIMELVKSRYTKAIEYIVDWVEENKEIEYRREIYNRYNINKKSLYVMLVEQGIKEIIKRIIGYITDDILNLMDSKGNNLILEMIYKGEDREYINMIRKIIGRVRKEVITNKEIYYNNSIDMINDSYLKDKLEYRDIYETIKRIIEE